MVTEETVKTRVLPRLLWNFSSVSSLAKLSKPANSWGTLTSGLNF